jgi:small basic protein (TIGR04137 family)
MGAHRNQNICRRSASTGEKRVPGGRGIALTAWGDSIMTMDKSLKVRAGLVRARSVLTRGERIARLREAERWQEGESPFGLPKVRVYKISMKKKKKKKKEDEEE